MNRLMKLNLYSVKKGPEQRRDPLKSFKISRHSVIGKYIVVIIMIIIIKESQRHFKIAMVH